MKPLKIFYCYSHADAGLRAQLDKHLAVIERQHYIECWHDQDISAGVEWKPEIEKHLSLADIILLLVSPDFLASDYCYDTEMERAMERHKAGEAHVIPIILRPVHWDKTPFGKLQALPPNAKPITSWGSLDEAFYQVVAGILKVTGQLDSPHPIAEVPPQKTKEYWLYRGDLFSDEDGDYEEALVAYSQAFDLDRDNPIILYKMGKMLSHLHRHKEALDRYREVIRLDPHNIQAYQARGDTLLTLAEGQNRSDRDGYLQYEKFLNEAAISYGAATRLDGTLLETYMSQARTLSKLNRCTEALAAYEQILQLDPDNVAASNEKGDQLYQLKQFEQAITAYDHSTETDTTNAIAYYGKGNVFSTLERYREAVTAYDKAVQLDPSFDQAIRARSGAIRARSGVLKKQQERLCHWRDLTLGVSGVSAYFACLCFLFCIIFTLIDDILLLLGSLLVLLFPLPRYTLHDLHFFLLIIIGLLIISITFCIIGATLHLKIVSNIRHLLRKEGITPIKLVQHIIDEFKM